MNIIFCGYRDWAIDIYKNLVNAFPDDNIVLVTNKNGVRPAIYGMVARRESTEDDNPLVLFVGWSWIVSKDIVNRWDCFCLHPSELPKYRGGSPIQNQILDGLGHTTISIFKMGPGLDDGDLYESKFPAQLNLSEPLNFIFEKLTQKGAFQLYYLIKDWKNKVAKLIPQDHSQATYCKRRKPKESEIKDFNNQTAEYWIRFIRCLQKPYPNPWIKCKDGTKLYINEVSLEDGSH